MSPGCKPLKEDDGALKASKIGPLRPGARDTKTAELCKLRRATALGMQRDLWSHAWPARWHLSSGGP